MTPRGPERSICGSLTNPKTEGTEAMSDYPAKVNPHNRSAAAVEERVVTTEDARVEGPRRAWNDADRELDFHPVMGMRWEITRSTEETDGELFETTSWLDARSSRPPFHVHPNTEESFEVIEGSLDVCKDGEWTTLQSGETSIIPAGVPHTLRNASDEPAKIVMRIRPAGRSEAFFRDMHGLIHGGKAKRFPPKEPGTAIYAAMLYDRYPDEIRATGALNVVFKALTLVGKALRFDF
jgi:quercetin dioxygenase-like cupin family protein